MKKNILAMLMSLTLMLTVGCSQPKETTVTDREGNEVTIPTKIERIVSTAPSNTEVLVDLGMSDKIVCVDKYSADVEGLNKDIEQIDFSSPDAETIVGLEPDIIIASGHNKTGSSEDPFKVMKEAGIPVVYLPSSDSIDGIYEDIEFIASIVDKEPKGEEIISDMKSKIAEIEKVGKTIKDKKKVYFEIAPAPNLFTFGNSTFLNEMVELVGAENIFKDEKAWVSPTEESVIDGNPDVILTNVGYVENPIGEIKSRNGWESINAIKNEQVYLIDKNSSSRATPNIMKALNEMAKSIYPDVYNK
ncbi:MAG: ABC transporter substrate-binding protein [Terrisporobacter sp.]|uniref:ABC transporter substrate-binding protein n=1 Tax=Terrisporobacter sp. TaxID=1965305 RepID=UPI002FCB96E5